MPTFIFASIRGNSGIDTVEYRKSFEALDFDTFRLVEPLFYLLQVFSKVISNNFQFFLFIQALFVYFFTVVGLNRIEKNHFPFISVVFAPLFLLDATFNGLRYGLSFSIFLFVLSYLITHSNFKFSGGMNLIISTIPAFAHTSSLFLSVLFFRFRFSIGLFLSLIFITVIGYYTIYEYLTYKFQSYSEISSPSGLSGLSTLTFISFNIFFCFFLLLKLDENKRDFLLNLLFLMLLSFSFFLLASYSYAFLRLLNILFFASCIITFYIVRHSKIKLSIYVYTISISLMIAFNFFRQILSLGYNFHHSFLPYEFFG